MARSWRLVRNHVEKCPAILSKWGEEQMEYLIGLALAVAVAGFAAVVGFDRDRAFYPTALIVIAAYYVLFAVMDPSRRALGVEIAVACGFVLFAVLGFKRNLLIVAAAIAGHGVFDFVHYLFIDNPGVPRWWPGFCGSIDVALGVLLAARLIRRPVSAAGAKH